jgi:hypothetical protein
MDKTTTPDNSAESPFYRFFASGPQGCFGTSDHALAETIIAALWDRDDWTVTDLHNPYGTKPDEV